MVGFPLAVRVAAAGSDPTGCSPGTGGIPDGVLGHVVCGTWVAELAAVAGWWPLLATVLAAGLAARLGWAVWLRRAWRRHAVRARWLEITPPTSATPAATVQLWRLAATLLPVPRWWQLRPARLVWEVAAHADRSRCGLSGLSDAGATVHCHGRGGQRRAAGHPKRPD
jgi:hypothetical protein